MFTTQQLADYRNWRRAGGRRRLVRFAATVAATVGLVLIVAAYLTTGLVPVEATVLVGGAVITHWTLAPRYSNGRAA